ncbi:hypothetical protein CNY89_30365, partial [Amaricoccus sp. HAR-UPW-R2A-40]
LDFGIHVKDDLDAFSTGYGPKERVLIAAQQLAIAQSLGRPPLFAFLDFGIHVKDDLDAFSTGYGPKERVL